MAAVYSRKDLWEKYHVENYTRGEVLHVEDVRPMDTHKSAVDMKVTHGTKVRNVMGFALKKIKENDTRQLTWNGHGEAISKVISCAEIMKRKVKGLHQITNIRFMRTEEYWEPKIDGLERLKVNKDIPAITILLSKDELDKSNPSYQAPGVTDPFSGCSVSRTPQAIRNRKSKPTRTAPNDTKSQFAPPSMDKKRKRKGKQQGSDTGGATGKDQRKKDGKNNNKRTTESQMSKKDRQDKGQNNVTSQSVSKTDSSRQEIQQKSKALTLEEKLDKITQRGRADDSGGPS